ncbi:MAG: type II secretion system F family protein [Acidimicrobiales bacterium]
MGAVSALAALLGAGVGLGIVGALAGWRGVKRAPGASRPARQRAGRPTVRLATAGAAGVLVGAVTGWPVGAVLAAAACLWLPSPIRAARTQAATIAQIEAIASWTEMLRDTLAAAAGLEQAIEATAAAAPPPIRTEVVALAARLEHERLGPALRAFADQVSDPTCDLVVAALLLAVEHQAQRLGDVLGNLAQAAREQATMRLRVEAGRARTRTSAKVIVWATVGLVLFLALFDRGYLSPYDSATGQLVLVVVGLVFGAAFSWLARMARSAPPARLLRAEAPGATEVRS